MAKNKNIFAWSQDEKPIVKRSLEEQHLNIDSAAKPVKQKLRPLGQERRQIALEEILKLKNSGFIKKVSKMASKYCNGKKVNWRKEVLFV